MKKKIQQSLSPLVMQLNEISEIHHLSKSSMARIAEVSLSTVHGWFRHGKMSKEAALALEDYTGVSLESLPDGAPPAQVRYSYDEHKLINIFRQCPVTERTNILLVLRLYPVELRKFYADYRSNRPVTFCRCSPGDERRQMFSEGKPGDTDIDEHQLVAFYRQYSRAERADILAMIEMRFGDLKQFYTEFFTCIQKAQCL